MTDTTAPTYRSWPFAIYVALVATLIVLVPSVLLVPVLAVPMALVFDRLMYGTWGWR